MAEFLTTSTPSETMSTQHKDIYGVIDDVFLHNYASPKYRYTRAEQIVLALIDQQRAIIDQYMAGMDAKRVAVIIGTTAGGMAEAESSRQPNHQFSSDYDVRFQRLGQIAQFTAEQLGAEGLVTGVSTACTSSARAIGLGMRWLALGWCDLAIVGGVDAMCGVTTQGFGSLEAVSTDYCKPFDTQRDGINLGEGGALLLLSRQQKVSDEQVAFAGYGESMDAWHISAPHPDGRGIASAMQNAISDSGYSAHDIGYVNMHGTATPANDSMEAKAVLKVLGTQVPVSSTKPITGHTLGAAGALEASICYALLRGDIKSLPIQHGLCELDPKIGNLHVIEEHDLVLDGRAVLTNSCGFGGHNASLVMSL